ncbi:hypothetical protein [Dactylosporangium sp. CA-139066]|uniref:hypothetical protein n=1 Tax=Dactylosporangium sp. CA-139066 TaxID=3239930 RepID=UPI003D8E35D4
MIGKLKDAARCADYTWANPPSLRWFADEPGGNEYHHREPRKHADIRPDEYPENDPEKWRQLAEWARVISRQAAALEDHAHREQAAAHRRRRAR